MEETRALKLTIEPKLGAFSVLHVWLNGYSVIMTKGKKGVWEGTVPSKGTVELEVVAYGNGDATFSVSIDLPNSSDDQKIEMKLQGGYREFKLIF
jgi:hypothetical protein